MSSLSYDLSVLCKLPFLGAERVSPAKSGIKQIQLWGRDKLTLDDKKIELILSEKQKGGKNIGGYDLWVERQALGGNVSAKVLDHLVDYPQMWPESWKKDARGNTIYAFFWDDIFLRRSDGGLCVRCGYWHGGGVVSDYHWLKNNWDAKNRSASLDESGTLG